jgi:peroxiredoxin
MSNSISVNSVAWRLLIVCNICLLLTVAYLLYDKYKAVNPQKYLLSGVTATAFEGTDEHGMPIRIDFVDKTEPTILMIFTTSCPACEGSIPIWKKLAGERHRVRFLGVSLDNPDKTIPFLFRHDPDFSIVLVTDKEFIRSYQIHSVPLTVLVGRDGKIVDSWSGILTDDVISQITEGFGG